MQSITGPNSSPVPSSVPAADVSHRSDIKKPESESPKRHRKPRMDKYIPEEKQEPTDRYRPEKKAERPEKNTPEKKAEKCTGNTDKVDREIARLKKKEQELKQQLNSETDENKIKNLKRQLAQIERELRQKDNDTYRRQHSEYTSF